VKRVSDYVIEKIQSAGVKHIFFVPGSGCMYLVDALARNKEITSVNMNHEQSAGMAALSYAKARNGMGACVVTTGCGGTNAVTALLHAWQDNIPCIFISGQAERNHTLRNSEYGIRQMGRQEADIVSIVSSISKYAVMVNDPKDVVYEVEKAMYIAQEGRKGPVWIDIPLDVQQAVINLDKQEHYNPPQKQDNILGEDINEIVSLLENSSRPVILAGNGVHLSGAESQLHKFAHKHRIPVVHSRLGCDIMPTDDELSIGMVGMLGASRAGNFAIQNSDIVLSIGCRLSINTTGYDYKAFAREAKIVVIDIDEEEHKKNTVRIDKFYKGDAKEYLSKLLEAGISADYTDWSKACLRWKRELPIFFDKPDGSGKMDMYDLADKLSDVLPDDAIVVSGAGDGYYVGTTGIRYREGQMSITSGAQAEMGFELPGAIGAYFATGRPVIVFVGDGSMMMNLQELATVKLYDIPLKIILINNDGYSCIRKLHQGTFRRYVGCDAKGGLGLPNWRNVADCFGINYVSVHKAEEVADVFKQMESTDEPYICEAECTPEQQFLSVTTSKNSKGVIVTMPLENQSPFMPRDIYEKEMIVDIYE
jgi:acetolactate synthase-1/2/3 large subunit